MKKSILAKAASIILASSLMLGMTACGDSYAENTAAKVITVKKGEFFENEVKENGG